MSKTTQKRFELSTEAETMINNLINICFSSGYRCKWVAYYFDRPEIGLFGIANLHRWSVVSDIMMARGLIEYLKVRGGRAVFDDIEAPNQKENEMEFLVVESDGTPTFESVPPEVPESKGGNVVPSLNCLLLGKRAIYDYVLKLYKVASESYDPHLTDFLEINYIRPVANIMRKLGILQSQALLACSEGSVGAYEFNKDVEKNLFKIMTVNKLVRPDKWTVATF